jgi:cysteine synthase
MTHADLIATVGRTPLVELRRLAKDLPGRVLAKLEMRNPCGNVKDRVAVAQAQKIANELPGAVILDQFRNPANPEIHRLTMAIESDAVTDEHAFSCARRLAREKGIIAGVSSGAAVHAALAIAARQDAAGKTGAEQPQR